ncbi:hypothetical protein BKA62DRAFT_676938 [Auriculariales sp. MPI-PUGE-AT-0066]|nr:hypothetical protein BKA62DRAFT_676938 [Auriculariales sp. MPI-PUGE-AT-0066]
MLLPHVTSTFAVLVPQNSALQRLFAAPSEPLVKKDVLSGIEARAASQIFPTLPNGGNSPTLIQVKYALKMVLLGLRSLCELCCAMIVVRIALCYGGLQSGFGFCVLGAGLDALLADLTYRSTSMMVIATAMVSVAVREPSPPHRHYLGRNPNPYCSYLPWINFIDFLVSC